MEKQPSWMVARCWGDWPCPVPCVTLLPAQSHPSSCARTDECGAFGLKAPVPKSSWISSAGPHWKLVPCMSPCPHVCPQPQLSPVLVPPQLNSPMNSVTSTEDIKPPLGLNGVLKVPAHPSGTMASFTKHICAICGDRSSGEAGTCPGRGSGQ